MSVEFLVFSGSSNPKLAKGIASHLSVPLGEVAIKRFESNSGMGEVHVEYKCNLRKRDIFIIQSLFDPVNENLMELLVMIDSAKRAKANSITVVMPYMGYSRQDRKDRPRVPITSELVATLIKEAGADDIVLVDLHAPQIEGFFRMGMDHISCIKILSKEIEKIIEECGEEDIAIVAPDEGATKMAKKFRDFLPMSRFAMISKSRKDSTSTTADFIVGEEEVKGRICFIVDDLTSTGGTLINGAELLMKKGAKKVYVAVVHGCFINNEKIKSYTAIKESRIEKILVTNTVDVKRGAKIKIIDVAPLIGECIIRVHDGRSISNLFTPDVQL